MAHVTGPFIEYPCSGCGAIVQENVHPDPSKLHERIVEANTIPSKRRCAGCGTADDLEAPHKHQSSPVPTGEEAQPGPPTSPSAPAAAYWPCVPVEYFDANDDKSPMGII